MQLLTLVVVCGLLDLAANFLDAGVDLVRRALAFED
jgi:hypothetical protein